jgi:hypothetical protein
VVRVLTARWLALPPESGALFALGTGHALDPRIRARRARHPALELGRLPAEAADSGRYCCRVFAPVALAAGAADQLADAVADAHAAWLLAAVGLHVAGQLARGLAWGAVLRTAWSDVSARRACAWWVCGAGLTGVLSARGGDAVRMCLAKREVPDATWPALAGTIAAEGSFEVASGVVLGLVALGIGVGGLHAPSLWLIGAVAAGSAATAVLAFRSPRLRRVVSEVGHGLAVLREPRRFARRVLPWQIAGRLLRLASLGCFLYAFGLPAAPAVVIAATVVQGSGRWLPIPGAGTAAAAAALLATLPLVTGHAVDPAAVGALAIAQPALLTLVGISVSLALLAVLLGARTPRALVRAARSLAPQPVGIKS